MSDLSRRSDSFDLITDEDLAKYRLQTPKSLWSPLNGPRNIRLLKIFSENKIATVYDNRIECQLEEWNLEEANGKYEALSYAWGDPGNGYDYIECNNITTKVWTNLHQALLQLRNKISGDRIRRTRLLWVDALCINQTEEGMSERQSQILLMKSIFGFASQTLIWLGEHDKASRQVWKASAGVTPYSFTEVLRNVYQWNVEMREAFIRRPWFYRVWTLQEVVLASKATLLCGSDEMDWTTFCIIWKGRYEFMKNLKTEIREKRTDHISESPAFIGLMHCFDIQQVRRSLGEEPVKMLPLSEIIIRTWYRDATEAHDRIYALLGLISLDQYPGLEMPDYSQPPVTVFLNVVKLAMATDKTPALLNIAGVSPEDMFPDTDLSEEVTATGGSGDEVTSSIRRPSWIPDWTKHGWENTWLRARLASDDSNARINPDLARTFGKPDTWIPIFEDNKLHIRGHIIGYLPERRTNTRGASNESDSSLFTMKGLSWFSGALPWAKGSLKEGHEYSLLRTGLPYDGDTTREGDVICVFSGLRSLFVVRMMFAFDFGVWGALEWLKEDINYEGLRLNCLLIGPVQVEGLELKQNADLSDGYWTFIIN